MRHALLPQFTAALLVGAGTASAIEPAAAPRATPPAPMAAAKAPEVKAGPYRIVVDRLNESSTLTLNYRTEGNRREGGPVQSRRSVQLQLAVYGPESGLETGLAHFQIKRVAAGAGGRPVEVAYQGGMLETPGDGAVLRVYVAIPSLPPLARELQAIDGEIVSYEKAATVDLEIPVEPGKLPRTVEKDGLKATLRELTVNGGAIRLVLSLEGDAESALIDPSTDGTHGVSVLAADNRAAAAAGGTLLQPRANRAEYRLAFQGAQAAVTRVRVRVLQRSGPRRVYPFRIERVPLVGRPEHAGRKHQ